ncbi:CoA-acylating methylmalonate-semialdehyde dehydrogenase [Nannocystis sp. RBIL2]|uniref:CoA-acylating methylmalonate-semialdehyde dehydrogenase n=1 Tax=Nannocystis sp. RBIL2 TaxID=2996788 RepID=UPI00226F63FB|nr:CoA-acylating methylmalonate-semialdehyde dehydrogenase [Nannocystis sp. RBIL2]MCY1071692.1 CoA-acylating methylmalonate-semialdehyde dehydrogenase [Nannocystis sp. RBIL2]
MTNDLRFPARSYDFTPYVQCNNWIGGEWTPSAAGDSLSVDNPRHGKSFGQVTMSGAADVARAVEAAKAAFPGWRDTPIKERVQVLFRLKALLERDLEELAWLVSHENGKVIGEARADVLKGIECLEYGISLQNMVAGEQLDVSRGINCSITYEPLGVCAGIVPFNFPIMVPLWMLPQALVSGNTFILKPSEVVPYGAMKLAELLREAGLPAGVFNTVNGGQPAVEAIADHPDIKAVGFVGSTRVARAVYSRSAAAGKRALCLGGAKNHLLVVPDADLELTSTTVVASAYGCAGQRCMAASLMIAVGEVDPIIDAIVAHARKLRLGEDMGPVIHGGAVERIDNYIADAERRGAKVLLDGRGAKSPGGVGHWVGPTILDHVKPDMPAGCEEIFGPVLSIVRARTVDEAIAIENASTYGNAASIFTQNGAVARYCIERFEAGMCGVNIGVPVPREPFSFGGWNQSLFGAGDLTGWDGLRFWTRARKLTTRWQLSKDATWMS